MTRMKLYASSTSPFARKVIIIAKEMDVHSLIEIVPYAVDPTKTGAVSQPNPLNKIPALDVDGIGAIYGSQVIVQYLLSLNPAKAGAFLAREGDPQRYLTLTLESLADGMTDALILCRFEEHLRPAELRWESWLAGQKAKVLRALDEMERVVGAGSGDSPLDLGKVAVVCALSYADLRMPEVAWRVGRPALARLFDMAHATRESVRTTVLG